MNKNVSDCISAKIREGYPRDQAIAICLNKDVPMPLEDEAEESYLFRCMIAVEEMGADSDTARMVCEHMSDGVKLVDWQKHFSPA